MVVCAYVCIGRGNLRPLVAPKSSPSSSRRLAASHSPTVLYSTVVGSRYNSPTTNGGIQNGSSAKICTHCIHIFACLVSICVLSWRLLTKFLHRSSVGSLLRVRCWLGVRVCLFQRTLHRTRQNGHKFSSTLGRQT